MKNGTPSARRRLSVALLTCLAPAALFVAAASTRAIADDAHRDFQACTGTYLITEGNGGVDLWTFHRDGTLVNTSLGEQFFNFSTQHGSWKSSSSRSLEAIQLDLHRTAEGALASVGRVDIEVRAADRSCTTLEGEFSGRLFEAGEDPLDLATDTGEPFVDIFTGRRVQ
jgi:hypothetical protein